PGSERARAPSDGKPRRHSAQFYGSGPLVPGRSRSKHRPAWPLSPPIERILLGPIIDPHFHVWKNDPKYPWAKEEEDPPKDDALPETLLRLMKANCVDKTVIVHVIYYRWDCRYAGDVIKANRKQFMGVCRVDPEAPSAAD